MMQSEPRSEERRRSTKSITMTPNLPRSISHFSFFFAFIPVDFPRYSVFELFRKKHIKTVDLSEVVDFKSILQSFNQSGEVPPGTFALRFDFDHLVFCIESRPGMWISRGNGFMIL